MNLERIFLSRMALLLMVLCCAFPIYMVAQNPLPEKDSLAIVNVLRKQQEDWNRGDIRSFMEGYRNSENLTFTGSSGVVSGWEATLERYLRSYPDKSHMGELHFTFLKLYGAGPRIAVVIGRFELSREMGNASGFFTLVLQKFSEGWRIISDHTSASE